VFLNHVTIVGGTSKPALEASSGTGYHMLDFGNSAIEGTPACALSTTFPVTARYLGNNASNDSSCGFVGAGDLSAVSLMLSSLTSVDDSFAHTPASGSPLIDAADGAQCPAADQVGALRPQDGDANGTAQCDIGAIEVPEPGPHAMLALGTVMLVCMADRRNTRPLLHHR
jgi:hypothetical protein